MTFLNRTSRICSNCGMSVPEGMQYCQECGTMYTAPAPATGTVQMYCPNGHTVTGEGYNFCVICSAKLVDTPPVIAAEKPAAPSGNFGWVCPKCHFATLEMDANFCTTCGAPRDRAAEDLLSEEVTIGVRGDRWPTPSYSDDAATVCVTSADSLPTNAVTPSTSMTPVMPVTPPRPGDVVIPPTRDRSIPDIPDIMRPLTNNDMKR